MQVTLSPLEAQIKSLHAKGETPPKPVVGFALIDTGAGSTCIDREAATQAGLACVDSGPLISATHESEIVPIFAGRLTVGDLSRNIDAHRAYGGKLEGQELIAVVGRDVLQRCVFVYNGLDGSFSLAI